MIREGRREESGSGWMEAAGAARSRRGRGVGLGSWILAMGLLASAEVYRPVHDDEVLERLPPDSRGADARRRREELASDPANLRDSLELARSYLDTAVEEGHPRMLGLVREVLAPWWDAASPPAGVLWVRSRVRFLGGETDRALAEVEQALAAEPGHLEAARSRVEYLLARGEVRAAREALGATRPGWTPLERAVLGASVGRIGSTPGAESVYDALRRAVESVDAGPASARREAFALLADLRLQAGGGAAAWAEAERWLERAAGAGGAATSVAVATADLLLERGDARGALERLRGLDAVDAAAMRSLAALEVLRERAPAEEDRRRVLLEQVPRRLEARHRRGDVTALADEAWYRLRVTREPGVAWSRAREAWAVRRGLDDVRLALACAAAANDREGAGPVLAWLRREGYADARMDGALRQLGGLP